MFMEASALGFMLQRRRDASAVGMTVTDDRERRPCQRASRHDFDSAHRAGRSLRGTFEPMISMPKRMTGLLSGSGLLAATLLTVGGSGAAVATAAGAAPTPLAQMLSSHVFLTPPTTADWRSPDRSGVLRALPVPEGLQPRTALQAGDGRSR